MVKGLYDMDKLTIKQTAEILKCSCQTVRRKISKGEIPAQKENTDFGEAWYIPADFINKPISKVDTLEKVAHISTQEIEKTVAHAIGQAVELALKKVVTEQTDILKNEIDQLRLELNSHYRQVDERIRLAANPPKQQSKGFFYKLFFSP